MEAIMIGGFAIGVIASLFLTRMEDRVKSSDEILGYSEGIGVIIVLFALAIGFMVGENIIVGFLLSLGLAMVCRIAVFMVGAFLGMFVIGFLQILYSPIKLVKVLLTKK